MVHDLFNEYSLTRRSIEGRAKRSNCIKRKTMGCKYPFILNLNDGLVKLGMGKLLHPL